MTTEPEKWAGPELDIATLAAAAAESRRGEPGWDEDTWTGALIATQHADPPWPWSRVWLAVVHEMGDRTGHPHKVIEAARDPLKRPGGVRRDEGAIARIQAEMEARAEEARIRGQERKRAGAA